MNKSFSLFVNFDDAGISTPVNAALQKCIDFGCIHGASILPTGKYMQEACSLLADTELNIAVHLDALEGPFLSGVLFPHTPAQWIFAEKKNRLPVRDEWHRQIDIILSTGMEISRLDSHRHLHHLPGLREIILDLAEEYGISWVRAARLPDRFLRPAGFFLDYLASDLQREAQIRGIFTSSSVLGFSRAGRITKKYLQRWNKSITDGMTELIFHPSEVNEWASGQIDELNILLSKWFLDWVGDFNES